MFHLYRCRVWTLLIGIILIVPASIFASEPQIQQQIESIEKTLKKNQKLTKDKGLRKELQLASRQLERARQFLEQNSSRYAASDLHGARRMLITILSLYTAMPEDLRGTIIGAVKELINPLVKLGAFSAQSRSYGGLHTITFATPDGWIRVRLPEDARSGEKFSGTVVRAGRDESHRAIIDQYKLHIADFISDPSKNYFSLMIPATTTTLKLQLQDSMNYPILSTQVPLRGNPENTNSSSFKANAELEEEPEPVELKQDVQIARLKFQLPTVGLSGAAFSVVGPFDGDFSTTSIAINRKPVAVVAETTRNVVFALPRDEVGTLSASIRENDTAVRCRIYNIRADLIYAKSMLEPGEQLDVNVNVYGLQTMNQPITLHLINQTLGAIEADTTPETVSSKQVGLNGAYTFTRKITGIQPVQFELALSPGTIPLSVCEPPPQ